MSYKKLYDFAQTEEAFGQGKRYISRKILREKAIKLAGIEDIKQVSTGADLGVARGFWLTPTNKEHSLVRQLGCHIVVTERGLNDCWSRFVFIKEMTHLFDSDEERTSSAEQFDNLLGEFACQGKSDELSPQWDAETSAVWKALALLCPEKTRLEFAEEKKAVKIDDYEIALRLKIPQFHVAKLFSENFTRMVNKITAV